MVFSTFNNITIGDIAADEGRKAILYKLQGKEPSPDHAHVVFKLSGESHAYIEDPLTGIFDLQEKFQSRTDSQVCCFASSAIFYMTFKAWKQRLVTPRRQSPYQFCF